MNKLLLILILTFSFQSLIKADDIRDFQIEGMSIGDSLLKYVEKAFIDKEKYFYPSSKKFGVLNINPANNRLVDFKTFDTVQFNFVDSDPKYKIHNLRGKILYKEGIDMSKCVNKKSEIAKELEQLFDVKGRDDKKGNHRNDESGKSKVVSTFLFFTTGGRASIQCYNWSKDMKFYDNLSVAINTEEFSNWLDNEAFK
tara:strand:- start:7 stop:600 length:594 start_codon:yes stop_codon:yes gene_type:complete